MGLASRHARLLALVTWSLAASVQAAESSSVQEAKAPCEDVDPTELSQLVKDLDVDVEVTAPLRPLSLRG